MKRIPPWMLVATIAVLLAGCLSPKQPERPIDVVQPEVEQNTETGSAVTFSMNSEQFSTFAQYLGHENTLTIEKPVHAVVQNATLDAKAGTRFSYTMADSSGVFTFEKPFPTIKTGIAKLIGGISLQSVTINADGSGVAGTGIGKYRFRWMDESSTETAPVEEKPEVWMYSTTGCAACEVAKKELADKDLPFTFIVKDKTPSWVQRFPTFHWKVKADDWRQRDCYDGKDRFVEMWKRSRDPKASAVSSRPFFYPDHSGYRASWTHPGKTKTDLINHLLNDGIHRGKHTFAELSQMSYSQLERLHDSEHNIARR